MLARRLTTILPDMTLAEAIETTRIHRVAGLTGARTAFVTTRPFRAPHHTRSDYPAKRTVTTYSLFLCPTYHVAIPCQLRRAASALAEGNGVGQRLPVRRDLRHFLPRARVKRHHRWRSVQQRRKPGSQLAAVVPEADFIETGSHWPRAGRHGSWPVPGLGLYSALPRPHAAQYGDPDSLTGVGWWC
jgi:Magnesium chelatase, subunit ChlI